MQVIIQVKHEVLLGLDVLRKVEGDGVTSARLGDMRRERGEVQLERGSWEYDFNFP